MLRCVLRSPFGETVVRDVVDGLWAEPKDGRRSDVGADHWALPGLIDAHAHFAADRFEPIPGSPTEARRRLLQAVRAGVMLAFDKGWTDSTMIGVARDVPPGERPELEVAGVMLATPGGYYPGFGREIDPAQIGEAVGLATRSGGTWVKLVGDWPRKGRGPVANFSEDELTTAVAVANEAGFKVAIHTMARDAPSQAVRAGVHSIEHGLFLSEHDLERLGARHGMWVPTVIQVQKLIQALGPDSSGGQLLGEGLANATKLIPLAVEAGVHVLAGTDLAVSTADVGTEAVRLHELGVSAEVALRSVSTAGLEASGRSANFDIGSPANAVFFGENPMDDPRVLAYPARILRQGEAIL